MRIVYTTLINLNDRHRPHTQKDDCSITDLSSSTVCDQVQKLLKYNFLKKMKGANAQKNDKTYIPEKNSGYIEDLIRLDRQYSSKYHGINSQGITYSEQTFILRRIANTLMTGPYTSMSSRKGYSVLSEHSNSLTMKNLKPSHSTTNGKPTEIRSIIAGILR